MPGSFLRAFRKSTDDNGLESQVIYHGIPPQSEEIDWVSLGRDAFAGFLDNGGSADSLICLHDGEAIGVLQLCRERNIDLPEDIRLIAVGGQPGGAVECSVDQQYFQYRL